MRAIVIGAALALLIGGNAFALSKCDSGIAKAKGKLVACECGIIAKGGVDVSKCQAKFQKGCAKAKSGGGCVIQTESCAAAQAEGDSFAAQHCAGSPSGAFLE